MNGFTIKELPISERPYEKCLLYGPEALSDAELLGVVLKNGTKNMNSVELATLIFNYHPFHKGIEGLNYLEIPDLLKIHGIGKVKAIQLVCVAEISKRISKSSHRDCVSLTSPESIARYFMESLRYKVKEEIHLLMFNTKHQLIKEMNVAIGTINQASTTPREIYVEALKYEAVFIILLHNHPSGDPTPSNDDIIFTKRVKEAGAMIGIILSDHIIIGDNKYVSLCERGLI